MGEFEDAVSRLKAMGDEDVDEVVQVLEGFTGTKLRKQAERVPSLERELEDAKAKIRHFESAPKIEGALASAHVDVDALRPAEREILSGLSFEGDAPSEDWVADIISRYGLPTTEAGPSGSEGEPEPNAAAVARQARSAPAGGGGLSGGVTPDDFAGWPMEKRQRFIKKYPEAEEQLGKGLPMTGIAFS